MSKMNGRQKHYLRDATNADFTENTSARGALRENEERLKFLFAKIPAMMHCIDAHGRIVEVSDQWLKVLGYSRAEVVGRKSVELLTAESRRYAEAVALPEFWRTGEARNVSYQFVRKDGEIVDILLSAVVEADRAGQPCRTLAILTDVTANRKVTGDQAAQEEQEVRGASPLLRGSPYGLTIREFTVLRLMATGKLDKQIAAELGISMLTVHKHVSNILGKMNAVSRTAASVRAVKEGLLD